MTNNNIINNIISQINMEEFKLRPKKTGFKLIIILIGIQIIIILYYVIVILLNKHSLNKKTNDLVNLSNYGKYENIKDNNLNDFLNTYDKLLAEKREKDNQMAKLQAPYNNLLTNIYLPSLNIWKAPYSTGININLLGGDYIDNNPYIDINLINKWTSFFKNIDNKGEFSNEIKNIKISEISENNKNGTFSMSIDVNFVAPSRKAFIMLVNKLSTTSNKKNISLINEFMFNLFEVIKNKEKNVIKNLGTTYSLSGEDLIISKAFYDWINDKNDGNNPLLKTVSIGDNPDGNTIIQETIKKVAKCDDKTDSNEVCLYKFRKKYSNIYNLAYTIGDPLNNNLVGTLKYFLQNMPPLTNVEKFVFRKKTNKIGKNNDDFSYEGQISITIYGKSITNEELSEIRKILGKSCFTDNQNMSFEKALEIVNNKINELSSGKGDIDIEKIYGINDIKEVIQKHSEDYQGLSNYYKTIKLFELYRILKENSLCKTNENK